MIERIPSKRKVIWGIPALWINAFPLYLGIQRGFFEKKGIDLEVRLVPGGPELAKEVQEGDIRIGTMGIPPFSKAFSDGLPAKVIGSSVTQQLDIYLVAQPEIHSITDLKGKRIGVLSFGSCDDYFNRYILQKESIDPEKDLTFVSLESAYGKLECITSKTIDASCYVEPTVSQGETMGLLRVLTRVGDYYPNYQWGIIFASQEFIEEDPDVIHDILVAYIESSGYIKRFPDDCISYGSALFGMEEDIFKKAITRSIPTWETEARIDSQGIENALSIQKDLGAISPHIKSIDMVDARFSLK
jgi:NitT/TauT family transport system substrate-binding protein